VNRYMDRRKILLACVGSIALHALPRYARARPAAQPPGEGGIVIDRVAYSAYIAAFNRRDLAGFTKFYAPDVRFILGGRQELVGRQAIIDWYEHAWMRLEEHCTIRRIILDGTGIAAELETSFRAIADWPDFTAGPLRVGDVLRRIGFIHYDIGAEGFTRVATAPHRVLEQPGHWPARP